MQDELMGYLGKLHFQGSKNGEKSALKTGERVGESVRVDSLRTQHKRYLEDSNVQWTTKTTINHTIYDT